MDSLAPTTEVVPSQPSKIFRGKTILYMGLVAFSVVALLPFFWVISTSLMNLGEILTQRWLPASPQFGNYPEAWEVADFRKYFSNSVIITAVSIVGLLTMTILSGYAFARIHFFGRNFIFTLLLATLMIPESVIMIPNFITIRGDTVPLFQISQEFPILSFGGSWLNTLQALTIPFMGSAFSIFLLRQFFAQIPDELWDAAQIDGAGHLRFLIQICLPISRPAVLTVTLLTFIQSWNAFLWPLIVTTEDTWRPIMVGLYNFTSEAGQEIHLLMAASVITITPILILYFVTQKSFTEGIATSGLKG